MHEPVRDSFQCIHTMVEEIFECMQLARDITDDG